MDSIDNLISIKVIPSNYTTAQIQSLITNGGNFIFSNATYNLNNLIVNSNTKLFSNNTILKPISSNKPAITVQGTNIDIDGLVVDCAGISYMGMYIETASQHVNITNVEIKNITTGNSPAYGLYISTLGCDDIIVDKCYVHDLSSTANGTEAIRDGGWTQGIIIDDPWYVNGSYSTTVVSKNITIRDCIIENINPAEDGDGLYVEGRGATNRLNVKILNNTFINCAKRAIKTLPCADVIIDGNYVINNTTNTIYSFISCYSNEFTITNNKCIKQNSNALYGIETGYNSTTYGNVECSNNVIENNIIDLGTALTQGREQDGIFVTAPASIRILSIKNNKIRNASYMIKIIVPNYIYNTVVADNIGENITTYGIEGYANFDFLNIKSNIINGNMLSGVLIAYNTDITGTKAITDVFINNNIVRNASKSAICLLNIDNVYVTNNQCYSNVAAVYIDTSTVTNYINLNNINLFDNSITGSKPKIKFYSKATTTTIDLSDLDTNDCIVKLVGKGFIISGITGSTTGQRLTVTATDNNNIIKNTSDIALKGSTNATLNFNNTLTLVRSDNRWLEISRNF